MAGQTASAADAMLKEFYIDQVIEAIKQEHPISKYYKTIKDYPSDGRRVVFPIHTARNSGVGARAEGGNLPTAGAQTWTDMQIPYRFNHARVQLTAQAIKQSKTSKGAFQKLLDAEIMGAAKDLGRDRNRQLFGDGNGTLCVIPDSSALSTHVVTNRFGLTGQANPAAFLKANDVVALINGTTFDQIATVSSVSSDLTKVTFTGPITPAATNETVVRASTTSDTTNASTGFQNEIMGLLGQSDDGTQVGTYMGIVRSSNPQLNAFRLDMTNTALTLDALQRAFDAVDQKSTGKVKIMWANHITRREYLNLLQPIKRYVNDMAKHPDGGWKGAALAGSAIEFNDTPIETDRDCPIGAIFGIDDSFLSRYVLEEGKWADEDGTVLLRVAGLDSYEARFRVFDNFVNENPITSFAMLNIPTTGAIDTIQLI